MLSGSFRRHRARPVGDAPVDPLLANAEELTKAWLMALLERAPLEEASRILSTDLVREGPRICEAVVRAIATDSDQRRLEPGGALVPLVGRVGELAGAGNAEAVSQAVDALQIVVWAALRAELRDPEPDMVSELAERLAQVAALVRAAALRHATESGPGPGLAAVPGSFGSGSRRVSGTPWDPRGEDPGTYPAARHEPSRSHETGPPRHEPRPPGYEPAPQQHEPRPQPRDPDVAVAPEAGSPLAQEPSSPRSWLQEEPGETETGALWVGALQEEISGTGDAPLSLLLAELEDADRLRAIEDESATGETLSEFAQAVRQAVRRQDLLVCDTPARAWIIARETGRGGARALGQRISVGVSRSRPWRGAPLVASVGIAVLGEDGNTPAELIEAAEEARFAASAAGGVA
jgi:GGDEF domain-containing protein